MAKEKIPLKFVASDNKMMGQRIKKMRKDRGISLRGMAAKLGISKVMYSYIESGKYSPYRHLDKICTYLNVNPTMILLEDPSLAVTHPTTQNMVPVYSSRASWDTQKARYYYNVPDWMIIEHESVFAVEARLIEKSTLLVDEEGLLFISGTGKKHDYDDDDLVFAQLGKTLYLKKYKDLRGPVTLIGLLLTQERRFI